MCGPPTPYRQCSTQNDAYAMIAAIGIVSAHATRCFSRCPSHRLHALNAAHPAMAPAIAWWWKRQPKVGANNTAAARPSPRRSRCGLEARQPSAHGVHDAHPPLNCPGDGRIAHISTHVDLEHRHVVRREQHPAISPAVFCASLEPCERLNAAADSNWNLRKYLSIFDGLYPRKSQ